MQIGITLIKFLISSVGHYPVDSGMHQVGQLLVIDPLVGFQMHGRFQPSKSFISFEFRIRIGIYLHLIG